MNQHPYILLIRKWLWIIHYKVCNYRKIMHFTEAQPPSLYFSIHAHLRVDYPLIIQQVVPTKQSDWSTRHQLALLPHHYKYYSAIDLQCFHGNIVTATIGVELTLNILLLMLIYMVDLRRVPIMTVKHILECNTAIMTTVTNKIKDVINTIKSTGTRKPRQ